MKRRTAAAWLAALAGIALLAGPAQAQAPGERSAVIDTGCNRACLIDALHDYLSALTARNPSLLKVSGEVRFTENNVVMPLGEGLWGTITGIAPTGLEVA